MISKTNYKPRFPGFYLLSGIVKIIDGTITIIVFLFGYTCDLYPAFCEWNLIKDAKKGRKHETPGYKDPNHRQHCVKDLNRNTTRDIKENEI